MRELSIEEQNLCTRINQNSGRNNFIGNIIDEQLNNILIEIFQKPNSLVIHYPTQGVQITPVEQALLIERIEEISELILTVVNLIKMLIEDGYIMLLQRGAGNTQTKFGRGVGNLPSITYNFQDQNIADLFIEYCTKEIYATKEFENFCTKGFISRQDRRVRNQMYVSTGILIIAGLALILNTIIFIMSQN